MTFTAAWVHVTCQKWFSTSFVKKKKNAWNKTIEIEKFRSHQKYSSIYFLLTTERFLLANGRKNQIPNRQNLKYQKLYWTFDRNIFVCKEISMPKLYEDYKFFINKLFISFKKCHFCSTKFASFTLSFKWDNLVSIFHTSWIYSCLMTIRWSYY